MQNRLLKLMLMVGLIPFYTANAQPGGEGFFFDGENLDEVHKKLKSNTEKEVIVPQNLEGLYVPEEQIEEQQFQVPPPVQQFQQQQMPYIRTEFSNDNSPLRLQTQRIILPPPHQHDEYQSFSHAMHQQIGSGSEMEEEEEKVNGDNESNQLHTS